MFHIFDIFGFYSYMYAFYFSSLTFVLCFTSLQYRLWSFQGSSHWLYRFLEGKKTSRFQFSVPGLRRIHSNLKQTKKFNFREGFFKKSPFCTFPCINPGFGGPWVMIQKKFLIAIFIMLQKNTFGQKNFWISCTGSKVLFWQFFIFAKMALLNPCMKFKIFFGQKYSFEALWKWQ